MKVDEETIAALSKAVSALRDNTPSPLPEQAVAALARVAKPGASIEIDLAGSDQIGAPLVVVERYQSADDLFRALTNRQRQVAKLIAMGLSNKAIARELGISVATVKDHVHAVLVQLELPSRAAVIAASKGFTRD